MWQQMEPKLCSPSELRTSGRPWGLLGEKYLNKLLEKQVSKSSDIQMYIYIYESEQTVVILPMEHVRWCDWTVRK